MLTLAARDLDGVRCPFNASTPPSVCWASERRQGEETQQCDQEPRSRGSFSLKWTFAMTEVPQAGDDCRMHLLPDQELAATLGLEGDAAPGWGAFSRAPASG